MAEYIEREAFLSELKERHDYVMQDPEISKTMKWCEAVCFNGTKDILNGIPAADVVAVVRCKDCKRCDGFPCPDNIMPNECGFCELDASLVKPDDFCSYGLRKDGE